MYRSQLVNGLFAEMEEALEEVHRTLPLTPSAWRTRWPGAHRKFPANARYACAVPMRRCWPPVVKKALPSADIAVDGSIRLGGVKLETQHILYDETLDFAAAAERAAF